MTLLQLPDSCLHHILQQLVPDSRSICSAAQGHTRLQAAAVEVQRSIKASQMRQHKQHQLKSLLLYLRSTPSTCSAWNLKHQNSYGKFLHAHRYSS